MKIKSFGCSFIFGNELPDDGYGKEFATASQMTWPALIAKRLNTEYECLAQPGSGNLRILEQVIHHAGLDHADTVFIVGWTWIDRFDWVSINDIDSQSEEKWKTITPIDEEETSKFYYRHLHSELRDKLSSLIYIRSAIDILEKKQIPFLMTYIDELILDRRWHIPVSVTDCQDAVKSYLHDFEGMDFINWARTKNYPIGQWLHPLEEAHAEAAKIMLPFVQDLINNRNNLS